MKKSLFAAIIIALACSSTDSIQAQKEIKLFNGKDLSDWNFVVDGNQVPGEQVYSVKDGVIEIAGSPFGYMYTKQKYGNCTLQVEWRWEGEATNSGIFLLIENPTNPFPNGIGSDLAEYTQPEDQERPKFPVIKKRNDASEKAVGEWNHAKIDIQDGVITVYINGVLQNKGTNKVKEGYIGLQSEGKKIQFRNVAITTAN